MSRDWRLYVTDIATYAEHARQFTAGLSFNAFCADLKTQLAVLRCLEIIGEAVKQVPVDELARFPDVPWRRVARFRDRLAHGYFGLDLEIVWDVVQNRLPEILPAVKAMLEGANG